MSETDLVLRRRLTMAKLWIFGSMFFLLMLGTIYQKHSESTQKKSESVVTASHYEEAVKPVSVFETARIYVTGNDPTYVLVGKKMLKNTPKESKDYQEARRLLAKLPSDSALELRIKKAEVRRIAAERRREASGEWSKERIDLELAIHPERKERMVRDYHAMYEAIKERYGAEEALRWDAEQRRRAR